MDILTQFAVSEPASGGIFAALGIDWKMLIFQIVAFLVLVVLLGKYVYPPLMKAVDARQENIEAGARAAEAAEKQAEKAQADLEKMMVEARKEASSIVTTAKEEATIAIEKAEDKAKLRAEHITTEAQAQLQKDIAAARTQLRNDTIELVALATEKVVGKTVTPKIDTQVIASAVKEAK